MPQRHLSVDEQVNRISVSLPKNIYQKIEKIATDTKVSIAWVVREAISKYLKELESQNE